MVKWFKRPALWRWENGILVAVPIRAVAPLGGEFTLARPLETGRVAVVPTCGRVPRLSPLAGPERPCRATLLGMPVKLGRAVRDAGLAVGLAFASAWLWRARRTTGNPTRSGLQTDRR